MVDEEYVKERNKLIPMAVKYANKIAGKDPGEGNIDIWSGKWNKVFHTEMTRLAEEAKLTNWKRKSNNEKKINDSSNDSGSSIVGSDNN